MKKFQFNCYHVLLATSFIFVFTCAIPSSSFSERALKRIQNLSHTSGKLGAYRALIIGINDYKDPKIPDLKTAVRDAKAMAELLREKYNFKINALYDRKATKAAIYSALRTLAKSSKSGDSVLIYYAGHGDLDKTYDDGWWIPSDAQGGYPVSYLDNGQVQKAMRSMKAKHVLLISDSCYSGTLFGQARAMPSEINDKYYLSLYNEKSRWGMTSGNKTPVSDSGTEGHSVFAYQLLKELKRNEKPFISTQEIYTRIAPIVANNSEQQPLCRPVRNTGDQGGEFIFIASASKSTYTPKPISSEPIDLPEESRTSFDDILNAAAAKEKAVAKWKRWQANRESEYGKVKQIDQNTYLTPKQKKEAWQRFLASASQDNPYSQSDDKMRSYSRSRMDYWENYQPAPKKEYTPTVSQPKQNADIVSQEGYYVAYANGVVYDKNTGLEWYAGPDKNTDWNEAKRWTESLNVSGGGWRMPKRSELKALYKKGEGSRNMTPLLKTTGWWVWSGETRDSSSSSAWNFGFNGGFEYWDSRSNAYHSRAFAVRSR